MYPFKYPHTIQHGGEEITFERIVEENGMKKVILSNRVQPNSGPPFHVHFKQDESLTVQQGKLGYQIFGQSEQFVGVGETIVFKRGEMHRFWNAGDTELICTGWVNPMNTLDYFLNGVYSALSKSKNPQGDQFDMAFLMTRYRTEYDMHVIPTFVKKVIMPITVFIGNLLGKYNHFKDAPEPIK